MKFGTFLAFLFLIYGTSFYLVTGQLIDDERSDCTKLMNFINGDSKDYANSCCSGELAKAKCDNENHVTYFSR